MSDRLVQHFTHRLALGTVQLGLNYGVSNDRGQVPESEACALLQGALETGIDTLDTARDYGTSEEVIGRCLQKLTQQPRIITKIAGIQGKLKTDAEIEPIIRASLRASQQALSPGKPAAVLLHSEADLLGPYGDLIWKCLESLRAEGAIEKAGVSFYSPAAMRTIAGRYPIQIAQVPFNLFDNRFFVPEMSELIRNREIEIHARSVFLQGMFFLTEANCPARMRFALPALEELRQTAAEMKESLAVLSLSHALTHPLIAKAVLGMTSLEELRGITSWKCVQVPEQIIEKAVSIAEHQGLQLINPGLWPIAE